MSGSVLRIYVRSTMSVP